MNSSKERRTQEHMYYQIIYQHKNRIDIARCTADTITPTLRSLKAAGCEIIRIRDIYGVTYNEENF